MLNIKINYYFLILQGNYILSITVTITKGTIVYKKSITITDRQGTVTFNDIQVGEWSILVQLFDAQGYEIYTGTGTAIVSKDDTTTVNITVNQNTGNLQINVNVPGLALWNKLGSDTEVQNSEIGPNGNIVGTLVYDSVKFNGGVKNADANSYTEFDNSCFNGGIGTVEFWFKTGFDVVNGHAQSGSTQDYWFEQQGDGQHGLFYVFFDDLSHSRTFYVELAGSITQFRIQPNVNWNANEIHHFAVSYDRNGINGTSKTVIVYLDGTEVASSSNDWGNYIKNDVPIMLNNALGGTGYKQSDTYIDNIKIWDYAKTNFDDRFTE